MLTRAGCQARQERFRALLAGEGLAAAVVSDPRDLYYLTGLLLPSFPVFPALLYVETEGWSWLAAHTADGEALVDERLTYEPNLLATLNPDPLRRLTQVVAGRLAGVRRPRRLGWQAEALPLHLSVTLGDGLHPDEWVAIDDGLAGLQRRKDPDEVALLRRSIACTLAAYDGVRKAIAPGVTELSVLEAGHRAATLEAGEPIFHSGDYRSAERGGPARDRAIGADELYIVDAWSTYRGYWSDLCRTFAVGEPTALQREVFDHLATILAEVPGKLKPGVDGTDVWRWMDGRVREHPHLRDIGLVGHGGHAIGVRGHEQPDINRDRGGVLDVGTVVCCEPGAYTPALKAGVRLENTYLVTASGGELLSDYPLALV